MLTILTYLFFCIRKKSFDPQQDELNKHVNIFFIYIYWHRYTSIYLIKCIGRLFNLLLEFCCKKTLEKPLYGWNS
jgi:hypothetical protein